MIYTILYKFINRGEREDMERKERDERKERSDREKGRETRVRETRVREGERIYIESKIKGYFR